MKYNKIITLTLAPAIDITYLTGAPLEAGLNRVSEFTVSAGGKGINVSRAILSADSLAPVVTVSPTGGATGEMFARILADEGIALEETKTSSPLRVNVSVIPDMGEDTEINAPGAYLSEDDIRHIESVITEQADSGTVVCICGSCPRGVARSYPAELCGKLRSLGCAIIMDCDGEALKLAVTSDAPPDLIKPNKAELDALCEAIPALEGVRGCSHTEKAEAVCALTGGITTVITTLGGDGSAVTHTVPGGGIMTETVTSRKVKPLRIKGAGDTYLGVYVYERFLKCAVPADAAGAASDAAARYVGKLPLGEA